MALLNQTFTVNDLPQSTGGYDPIPAGMYTATINSVELKDSRSGGQYLNIRYDITGPSHQGRVLFGMLNIRNPNPRAEEIGLQQLGELLKAIGLDKLSDTDELIGGQLQVKVDIEKSEQYGEQNRIRSFRPLANAPAANSSKSTATPPWKK